MERKDANIVKLNTELESVKVQIAKYEALLEKNDTQEKNYGLLLIKENGLKETIKALEGSLWK